MPASPATRISPVRGLRADNHHKRGHSLESGILFRERDDDLALFNEVQNKEKDCFLLQSNDDFDDIFGKFPAPWCFIHRIVVIELCSVCIVVFLYVVLLTDVVIYCLCFQQGN